MLFILISPGLRSGTLMLLELFGALEAFSGGEGGGCYKWES